VDLQRLSGPAFRAFLNLARVWELSVDEQRALLGGVPRTTFQRWRRNRDARLTLDQLERVSHLLGIYKNLQILLPTTGDQWIRRPNANPIFSGHSALALMIPGGITWLCRIREFLGGQVSDG